MFYAQRRRAVNVNNSLRVSALPLLRASQISLVSTAGISSTVERMADPDHSSTYAPTISKANTDPPVIGTFASEFTANLLAAQKVHHASLSCLPCPRAQLRCINALEAHRGAVYDNRVGVSELSRSCGKGSRDDTAVGAHSLVRCLSFESQGFVSSTR